MSSFIFAIGNRLCLLCLSLLFISASKLIENEYKKTFIFISFTGLFISIFFIIQIFVPKSYLKSIVGIKDLPNWCYYLSMTFCAISSCLILNFFQKAMIITEYNLLRKIVLAKKIINGFIVNIMKWEYKVEDKKEFRNDFYSEINKIKND